MAAAVTHSAFGGMDIVAGSGVSMAGWPTAWLGCAALAPILFGHAHFAWFVSHFATLTAVAVISGTLSLFVFMFYSDKGGVRACGSFIGMVVAGIVMCCIVSFCNGEVARGVGALRDANRTVAWASENTGAAETAAIVRRLANGSRSWAAYVRDRAFVEDVVAADTNRDDILTWLSSTRAFGLDGAGVADSGMVKPSDQTRLFQRAVAMSKTGDRAAMAWIAHRSGSGGSDE